MAQDINITALKNLNKTYNINEIFKIIDTFMVKIKTLYSKNNIIGSINFLLNENGTDIIGLLFTFTKDNILFYETTILFSNLNNDNLVLLEQKIANKLKNHT